MRLSILPLVLGFACATPSDDSFTPGPNGKGDGTLGDTDIVSTDLAIDVGALAGTATIRVRSSGQQVVFESAGLLIDAVRGPDGPLDHAVVDGKLYVETPAPEEGIGTLAIDYRFTIQDSSDGLLAGGSTLTWPYFCGNLFPCHSAPADGTTFTLALSGVPEGEVAVYPPAIAADAPGYMLAWAVGAYTYEELGVTAAGTEVGVYWLPHGKTAALDGTVPLVEAFDWYERTLGAYTFGDRVAAVSVVWGAGAYGGMEHHPYWHVAREAMSDRETQVHEAGHGWYGDGVRIRCWEDFVLSEGTTSYITARALGAALGAATEAATWTDYQARLEDAVASADGVAWPEGCNQVNILKDGLFSEIPYMKGAFFLRAVAAEVGVEALDAALGSFYLARVGAAAGMQDLIDHIEDETGFDPSALAVAWLRQTGIPR